MLSLSPYFDATVHLARRLRLTGGLRLDHLQADDRSSVTSASGEGSHTLLQPKGSLAIGPWAKTEMYFSIGKGFHSNDARGVFGTVPSLGSPLAGGDTPLMSTTTGFELGLRTVIVPRLSVQVATFQQDFGSELVYNPDLGSDEAGAPSRRQGIEISAQYHPFRWLEVNTDLALAKPRYRAGSMAAFGLNAPYIADAPNFIYSLGILVERLGPWSGGLQWRRLSARIYSTIATGFRRIGATANGTWTWTAPCAVAGKCRSGSSTFSTAMMRPPTTSIPAALPVSRQEGSAISRFTRSNRDLHDCR